MPAGIVLGAPLGLQDLLGGMAVRGTWDPLVGLEKKVIQALLVLKDLQGHQENLVPLDHLATKEQRVTWLYQELKGTRETEDLMGHQDFLGSMDHMVGMDLVEKRGIQDPQGIMKMQSQVVKGFLDLQAPLGKQESWGLLAWDFLVHREREVNQELQATQA